MVLRYWMQKRERESMIRTERLTLRKMSSTNFEAFDAVLGDTENMRHSPCTFDEKRVKNWILSKQKRYQILGFGLFAVCLGETGERIGDAGLTTQVIHDIIRPEIG
jgi:RimJ/RimL family protein N-acetyltransferase